MARAFITITNAKVKFGDAPTGDEPIDPGALTDYGCQVTSAVITATANNVDVPATYCEPASQVSVGSSFALDVEGLQDWGVATPSFSEWLFANDGTRKAFALYLEGEVDPRATGIVSVAAGDFGGPAGEILTWSGSFPILGYPTITNNAGSSIRPDGSVPNPATGATAGDPGSFTPSGSSPPSNLVALQGGSVVASPATAWTIGQHVILGDASQAYWDGDSWEAGEAI